MSIKYFLMYSSKYNQQNATLYNILYYCQCFTCFGLFLRPTPGAQKLYTQHLLCAVCTVLELLMMGGEIARNMYHSDNNKEYCITLHLAGGTWKNKLTMHGHMNVKNIF